MSLSFDPNRIGQLTPRLFVGGMMALQELLNGKRGEEQESKNCDSVDDHHEGAGGDTRDDSQQPRYTIISILETQRTIDLACSIVQQSEKQVKHEIWRLADKTYADFFKDSQLIENFFDAIEGKKDQGSYSYCLVHCAQGISRSVTLVAAYMISRQHLSVQESLDRIRQVWPRASPNLGFVASLRALEQCQGDVQRAHGRLFRMRGGVDHT